MSYWCDDQRLNIEQRRLDAYQAEVHKKMTTLSHNGLVLFDDHKDRPAPRATHLPVDPAVRAAAHALAARSSDLTRACTMPVMTPAVLARAVRQAAEAELESQTIRLKLEAQVEQLRLQEERDAKAAGQ